MSAASSALPSPTELENLGLLFIGFVASTVLYGLTFFQTYIYYSRYPRDYPWIRYFVAMLSTLDTATSALISEILYYYLIILFDVNMEILYATTTFCVQYMLSVVLTFISQLFFAHRVFQVTGGSGPLRLILILLSLVALALGLATTAQMLAQRRLSEFGSLLMQITAAFNLATSVIADLIIFVTMCYSLRRARYPDMAVPDGFLQTVVTVLVGRGLAFTIIQITYFCIFLAAPSKQYWIPLQMITSKLYVNTLLGHLNSRDVRQGQGLYEEDSITDRKALPNGPFTQSLRLNVTDVKPTSQSVNLATRHTDTSSDGIGLESRKTFQDEQGNSYMQVSTGTHSTQSQVDNDADKQSLSERV